MIQLIRGFKDILPGETELWQKIEQIASSLLEDFGYRQIRIPVMEKTELFARSIGEDTDIVEKEMYTFPDRKGDLITLRPEATASIVRSYIQHKLYAKDPVQKFYTIGPMFRRERPQKGRYRQFYQIDVEVFGNASPYADVGLIYMLNILLDRLEISDSMTHVNSLGCPECRPAFKKALSVFLDTKVDQLCADCKRRKDRSPLRVLDCKVPSCREAMKDAPAITDSLCDGCREHFDTLKKSLETLNIPYEVDKRLVRGLDYYTRTIFEIQTGSLGAQSAVVGGGRYDGLVKSLGGPNIPATGFAIGFDRLAEICGIGPEALIRRPDLFIAALGPKAQSMAFEWSARLGEKSVQVEMDFEDRSLKSQMKRANKLNAHNVLIIGENEIQDGFAVFRNMTTKEQKPVPLKKVVETVLKYIS